MTNVNVTEGVLNLVFSSSGEIKYLEIPIIKKKSGKDLVIDETKF